MSTDPPKEVQSLERSWSEDAKDDLKRLGCIMSQFFGMQPFYSESNFAKIVEGPLKGADGPEYGAIRRVERLMQTMMVKNRWDFLYRLTWVPYATDAFSGACRAEDIALEVPLPPLTATFVDLSLGRYAAMTYNVLQGTLAGKERVTTSA
jgi:hypothetical protein